MRCAVPNWTPLFIFCPRIEFRLNDARLVLETHAWQMHKARETGLKNTNSYGHFLWTNTKNIKHKVKRISDI